jgi:hypothetical protein
MELHNAVNVTVKGGAVEGCGGNGVVVGSTCDTLTFIGTNNEYNAGPGGDWDISGNEIFLINCLSVGDHINSTGLTLFRTGANSCQVFGGRLDSIVVQAAARDTYFHGVGFNISGSGTITVADDSTCFFGHNYNIAAGAANGGNTYPSKFPFNIGLSYALAFPAWDAVNHAVINLGAAASLAAHKATTSPGINLAKNAYLDSAGVWRYRLASIPAELIQEHGGAITFYTAGAGAAGAEIAWTAAAKFAAGVFHVNDGGTLKPVSFGAADSGGAGFKVMRIAN